MSNKNNQAQLAPWLDDLASASPAPGGGAAAAVGASMGASLICMVCNLTIGKPQYAEHESRMKTVLAAAEEKRHTAFRLADDDAAAFDAVIAAYQLPRGVDAQIKERKAAIQTATFEAAMVALRTAQLAGEVISLGNDILDGANKNVISDIAVAALMARCAVEASAINVEINLASLTDPERKQEITAALNGCRAALNHADVLVEAIRTRIKR